MQAWLWADTELAKRHVFKMIFVYLDRFRNHIHVFILCKANQLQPLNKNIFVLELSLLYWANARYMNEKSILTTPGLQSVMAWSSRERSLFRDCQKYMHAFSSKLSTPRMNFKIWGKALHVQGCAPSVLRTGVDYYLERCNTELQENHVIKATGESRDQSF